MLTVNGELIPTEAIYEEKNRLRTLFDWDALADLSEREGRLHEAAQLSLTDRTLVRQIASNDPAPMDRLEVDAEVARFLAYPDCRPAMDEHALRAAVELDLRINRTAQALAGPIPPPSDSDLMRVYRSRKESFRRPEMVHAAHIVKHGRGETPEHEARAALDAAMNALNAGEPFSAVAERYSDCRGTGSDLGSFPRGQMVKEFEEIVFSLAPGQRSPIFETPFGLHIAEVRAHKPSYLPDFDEVREEIRVWLTNTAIQMAMRRAMERLRSAAAITGFEPYAPSKGCGT